MKIFSLWASALLIAGMMSTSHAQSPPVVSEEYCDMFKECVPVTAPKAEKRAAMMLKFKLARKDIVAVSAESILDGRSLSETIRQVTGGRTISDVDIIYKEVLKDGKIELCAFLANSGC